MSTAEPTFDSAADGTIRRQWDPCSPLAEQGTWLLEASAGTGKTWQLASLVARLVIEQETAILIERILIITFTNAATAELRHRVRERLAEVRDTLSQLLADKTSLVALRAPIGVDGGHPDAVLRHLCIGPAKGPELSAEEQRARLMRAKVALSSFDLAPISTIHGFCQRMLDTLAFESGLDAGLELLDDVSPLRQQLVADAIATQQATKTATDWKTYKKQWHWQERTLARVAEKACSGAGRYIDPVMDPSDAAKNEAAIADAERALRTFFETGPGFLVADALIADAAADAQLPKTRQRYKPSKSTVFLTQQRREIAAWVKSGDGVDVILKTTATFGLAGYASGLRSTKKIVPIPLQDTTGDAQNLDALLSAIDVCRAAINPLAGFAYSARATMANELKERRAITFDSMLSSLAEAIESERDRAGERPLCDAIRAQFDVALIDEFQDTDLAQWTVIREVFHGAQERRLFLIGDPKQAIYRFRGADVYVYLDAKKLITEGGASDGAGQFTMARNYRSDGDLVAALNAFWGDNTQAFGDLQMDYEPVDWSQRQTGWYLRHAPAVPRGGGQRSPRQPLEVRWLDGGEDKDGERRLISEKGDGLRAAATCCANEIAELLASSARLYPRGEPNSDSGQDDNIDVENAAKSGKKLRPGDFAVLVHEHKHGRLVKLALAKRGILAVAGGKDTVFQSPVAAWLLQLLDALAQPGYEALSKALAVSPLIGFSLQQLDEALVAAEAQELAGGGQSQEHQSQERQSQERQSLAATAPTAATNVGDQFQDRQKQVLRWDLWRRQLEQWAQRWQKHRFAGAVQRISRTYGIIEQLLSLQDGERLATDFRHLFELCHVAERQHHFGPAGLADWLRKERGKGSATGKNNHSPRLESDAKSVQILTTYGAKGLQYPIVLLPFAWAAKSASRASYGPIVYHPMDGDGGTEGAGDGPASRNASRNASHASHNASHNASRNASHVVLAVHPDKSAAYATAKARDAEEDLEERLRKLYVEMTRAEHHCVIWAGAIGESFCGSPFNALLLRPTDHVGLPYTGMKEAWSALRKKPRKGAKNPEAANATRFAANRALAAVLDERWDGQQGIGWRYDAAERRGLRQLAAAGITTGITTGSTTGTAAAQLGVRIYAGRDHLASAWRRASFSSMAPSLGSIAEDSEHAARRPEAMEAHLRGGADESDMSAVQEGASDSGLHPAPVAPVVPQQAEARPLPLAKMWGGTSVGTWAHAILEHLDFQPKDEDGEPVVVTSAHLQPHLQAPLQDAGAASAAAINATDDKRAADAADMLAAAARNSPYVRRRQPPAKQRQTALAFATELGAQHGHRRAVDHQLFVAALPQILNAPLSVPGLGAGYGLPQGYCLQQLELSDRIDELAFDMSLAGGDHWRPTADGLPGERIDVEAVKQAFSLRGTIIAGTGAAWDGAAWIDGLLARVAESERDLATWQRESEAEWLTTDPNRRQQRPRAKAILPRIAGMLTGFIDLTFRTTCADGQLRYFIADYKTNKITSPGDREVRREHYTRPWLAWSMAHSNYHLQSLIYTLALHRFLGERLPGYDVGSQASYDTHVGGHFYLYLRGMAMPYEKDDAVHVHGVYADRWPWHVIDAFDRALDPGLRERRHDKNMQSEETP